MRAKVMTLPYPTPQIAEILVSLYRSNLPIVRCLRRATIGSVGARTDGRTHRLKVPARSQRWYHWALEAILSADKALIVGSCIRAETASFSS